MNVRLNNSDGMLYGALGRFSLQEAGGVFSDGAEIGFRWTPNWRTSFFGGLEPKRFGQTYVGFNSDSSVLGTYTTYQLKSPSLSKNLYWSTALVGQNVQGNMDRLYWYNNTIYQWSAPNQVVAMVYLDFVPRLNIQSALISAHQDLSTTWATNLSLTAVDVIEYMRIQGVLQTLASSPYREAALNIRAQMYSGGFFDTNLVYGARTTDSLVNADISVGPSFYRLFDGHASFRTLLGARRHFDGNEAYTRVVGSYFSKSWEFNLSANFALNVQSYGSTRHKWINDLSATRFFSTDFLAVVSLQEAHDETVQIWSGLFRLSYIFGQKATAPIRDTAPRPQPPLPAGRLY